MRALATGILVLVLALCGCSFSGSSDAAAKKPKRPHAVLLVFDEFPGDTLLGPDGRIDAGRFPHFAALAGDSTWFRNAHTAYDSTTKAVPLVLDGIRPQPGTSPIVRDHPHSIFTALGRRGYRIVTSEEATAICPARYCPSERTRRPAIIPNLKAGRAERFGQFIRSIRASRRPTFWMKHALLPHGPWVYLPSGQRSRPEGPELLPGMQTVPGFYDEYLTDHNEQRYLLQLGFVDRLLGRLVARLKSQGMYDDTLIVVTADHGFAWQVGVPTRRSVNALEREGAGSGSAVREGAEPDARPRERRARPDARRDPHDRGRAERAARIPHGRPLGVLARGPRPPRGEPHQARLQLDRAHARPGAGRRSAAPSCGAACAISARATGRASTRASGRTASSSGRT